MRRIKKKRNSKIKIVLTILIVCVCLGFWFSHSSYRTEAENSIKKSYTELMQKMQLTLKKVNVEGRNRTNLDEIHQVTNLSQGMPIFDVDLTDIHDKISLLPWVKSVLIERQLPSTLSIIVTEKTPIALWQNNKKYMPLDEDGHPIQDERFNLSGLILVVGQDAPEHTVELLQVLKNYPDILNRVKSAVRIGNRRWDLILDKVDGLVIELPEKDIDNALNRLQKNAKKDNLFQKDITSINLREKDRLIVSKGGKK